MAKLKSSKKRIKSNERKRIRNLAVRTKIKTAIKDVQQAIAEGNIEKAKEELSQASSILDSASAKGIVKKKAASRKKSRLAKKLNEIQVA